MADGADPADSDLTTGDPEDDKVLRMLASGGPLDAPRHWMHFLYCSNEAAARGAARAIEEAGWTTELARDPDGAPVWQILAEQHGVVISAELIRQTRSFFTHAAEILPGGEYDGWAASA
jgi:Regulator of ribonuclease activity B